MSIIALLAGGTGGHLSPAQSLAEELGRRGHEIHLFTDHRVSTYSDFPARAVHVVPSATPSVRDPLKFVRAGITIGWGIFVARGMLRKLKPHAVVGFGGYPVFPPFVAASLLKIPGILHEQNAVMGRANVALARFAKVIAVTFERTDKTEPYAKRIALTGNPVRDSVRALAGAPYPPLDDGGPLNLLVFGGSQGARAFADIVPPAIAWLGPRLRARIRVTQQCRPEDLDRVAEAYRQAKISCELNAFFQDLPERIAQSHLVISRSGASTIAELSTIGRPAILIPLPGAIDADQRQNARIFERAGAGWMVEQATLSPQSLGTRMTSLVGERDNLKQAAAAARALGNPDAVERLADIAETLAARGTLAR